MKIGIVLGSIREGRFGAQVAEWVMEQLGSRGDATFELIDLKVFDLPLLTSPVHPMAAKKSYEDEAVQGWSDAIDACDGYVFVTAEYNHSIPGAFKNAVDCLGAEWVGKTVAFVSYGAVGGHRAVEHWRGVIANFSMTGIRSQVSFNAGFDFDGPDFHPIERRAGELSALVDDLVKATARA